MGLRADRTYSGPLISCWGWFTVFKILGDSWLTTDRPTGQCCAHAHGRTSAGVVRTGTKEVEAAGGLFVTQGAVEEIE